MNIEDISIVLVLIVFYVFLLLEFVRLWIGEFLGIEELGKVLFFFFWKGYGSDDEFNYF